MEVVAQYIIKINKDSDLIQLLHAYTRLHGDNQFDQIDKMTSKRLHSSPILNVRYVLPISLISRMT